MAILLLMMFLPLMMFVKYDAVADVLPAKLADAVAAIGDIVADVYFSCSGDVTERNQQR